LISGDYLPAINFSGNVVGGSYSWTKLNGTIANLPLTGEGSFPGASDIQIFNEPSVYTGAAITATYNVVAHASALADDCNTVTKQLVITLYPKPQIVGNIIDTVVCHNTTYTIVTNKPEPDATVTYKWAYESGNTQSTITQNGVVTGKNTTTSPATTVFSVRPYNEVVGRYGDKVYFSVTVQPELKVDDIFVSDKFVQNGQVVSQINFGTTISGAHFRWEVTANGTAIGMPATSGIDFIPSFTAKNETGNDIEAEYKVWIEFNGCTSDYKTFKITVTPALIPTVELVTTVTPAVKQTVCWNEHFADITLKAEHEFVTAPNLTNVKFRVELIDGDDVLGIGTVVNYQTATNTYAWNLSTAAIGTVYGTGKYKVTPIWQNRIGQSVTLEFTRKAKPAMEGISNIVLCSGDVLDVKFDSPDYSATSFSWTSTGTIAGFPATGTSTGALKSNGPLVNDGNAPVVITVTVTPKNAECAGTATSFTVTVNPTPKVSPALINQFVQAGATATINVAGVATRYEWSADANFAAIAGVGQASSGVINGNSGVITVVTKAVNEPVGTTITVIPYYNNCVGTPVTVSIVVANKPIIADLDDVYANDGDNLNGVNPNGLPAGSSYGIEWTGGAAIGLADGSGRSIPPFTVSIPASADKFSPYVATVTVTPYVTVGGVKYYGEPITYTYTIYPKVTIAPEYAATHENYTDEICSGDETGEVTFIAAITSGYEVAYQWYKDGVAITGAHGIVDESHQVTYTITNATGDDAGLYYVVFGDNVKSAVYELIVKKAVIYQQWNNVLVIADASTNGGYTFKNIEWYKDGVKVAGQTLSYLYQEPLSFGSKYHFTATDQNDKPYVSCDFIPVQLDETVISVYPNPVKAGEEVTVKAPATSTIEFASPQGVVITSKAATGAETKVKVPNTPGVYIINVTDNNLKKSISVIVK
jgi:hypothetical protein